METLSLFTDTIYCAKAPNKLVDLSLDILTNAIWKPNASNYTTKDHELLFTRKARPIIEWFDECLEEVRQSLGLTCDKLKVTRAWGNRTSIDQSHHVHTHPNSWASAVFYLSEDSAGTYFSKENHWYTELPSILPESTRKVTTIHAPEKGELIIFPSSTVHWVQTNYSPEPRYTISFNSFPSGNIWYRTNERPQQAEMTINVKKPEM